MNQSGQSTEAGGSIRLVQGIAILGAAAMFSKLLGTLQKIPLQNLAGDEAYGIYSAVYPFYVLILVLATAGFPTAVSKLVSEQTAAGNAYEARRIYRMAAFILCGTGVAGFVILYGGADLIAHWIGSAQAAQALRSVSFALLLVPLMASSRGYFQGLQNMVPTAISQVVEQTIRVAVMIALLLILTSRGASSGLIAAGATFGSAAGACAGLIVMMLYDVRERARLKGEKKLALRAPATSSSELMRRIIRYAMPVALGSIVVPLISMIDSFTLPRLVAASYGLTESEALHQFGIYARGLPLVQLVAMLFGAMSTALVPALSNAKARGDDASVQSRAAVSLRLTWLIGLAASVGLAAVSLPVNIMLYTDRSGTLTMAIIAWTALFSSINVITAALLQGVGLEKLPALHLLLAAVVKVILNLALIPYLGIAGAACSGIAAFAVASLLNLHAMKRHIGLHFRSIREWKLAAPALAAMLGAIIVLYGGFAGAGAAFGIDTSGRLWNTVQALLMVGIGSIVFIVAAIRSGALREDELKLLPGLYRRMAPWLRKWRILPPQSGK